MKYQFEERLCLRLRDVFVSVLKVLYKDNDEIPKCFLTFVFDYQDTYAYLYETDSLGNIIKKKLDNINYDQIRMEDSYESIIIHRFTNCTFSFLLKLEKDEKKSLMRSLARVFFERMLKPLSYVFEEDLKSSPQEWRITGFLNRIECEHEEDVIISRAILEYFHYIYDLDITLINNLSGATYEGRNINCGIIIPYKGYGRGTKRKHSSVELKLADKILFNNIEIRKLRKMLEIATVPLNLVVGRNKVILGYTTGEAKHYECRIVITGRMEWKVFFEGICIKYLNGTYRIVKQKKEIDNLYLLKKTCMSEEQFEKMKAVINEAAKQEHGTLLVIAEEKSTVNEVERLCRYNRGIKIKKFNLFRNLSYVQKITAIDGAVFIDYECNCYGIGIILDGDAVMEGLNSRGARYNSSVNYVKRRNDFGEKFIAVIISEDKPIDIFSGIDL